MLIGIIGAGLSGLIAGEKLAKAGHDVIILEKSNAFGGRLSTRYNDESGSIRFDHGSPHISGKDPRFLEFLGSLEEKGILKYWADGFHYWNGHTLLDRHPERESRKYYYAPEGMNAIGKHLSRYVDVRTGTKVIGFTYFGDKRFNKRPWIINLENFDVLEVDAVVIATPAVQAYGLIDNTQDETYFKSLIKDLDEISYNPKFSLMLTYGNAPKPAWKGIDCVDDTIHWISNESSKRDNEGKTTLVCQSKGDFTRRHLFNTTKMETVEREMVTALKKIIGDWAGDYDASQIHLWRYSQAQNFLDFNFVELGTDDAPVAVIGDYLKGGTVEHAFLSGYELADYWIDKYPR